MRRTSEAEGPNSNAGAVRDGDRLHKSGTSGHGAAY
jgi:hypothetical protein